MGAGSDTDLIMDLYGWLSLLVLAVVIVVGIIMLFVHAVEAWMDRRALRKAQHNHEVAKAEFLREHGY